MITIKDLRRSKMPQCKQSDCALKGKCKRYRNKPDTEPVMSGRYPKAKLGDILISNAKPEDCGYFIAK